MNNKNTPKDFVVSSLSDNTEPYSNSTQVAQEGLNTNSDTPERLRHDELFKKVMSEPVAAREFLEHYLPVSFKNKINLNSVKIEKESFVTESLRKDLVMLFILFL